MTILTAHLLNIKYDVLIFPPLMAKTALKEVPTTKTYKIAVIQDRPSQLDSPLFRKIAQKPDMQVVVYYLDPDNIERIYDPEILIEINKNLDLLAGYEYNIIPRNPFSRFRLIKHIIRSNFDIILISGYRSLTKLYIAYKCQRSKKAIGLRSDTISTYKMSKWKEWLKPIFLKFVYKLYTSGHPTGLLAKEYMKVHGFKENRLFFHPYTSDYEYLERLYEDAVNRRVEIRSRLRISQEAFTVLGILKFVHREDPMSLLKSFSLLTKSVPHAHLVLVGDGILRPAIENYVYNSQLNNVHLPGFVLYEELPKYFAVADVYVHPARIEPWGVTLNEAMVCMCPVVSADTVGSSKDLILEGETGFIFQSGNTEQLSSILLKLSKNKELRFLVAKQARAHIEKFSNDFICTELKRAIDTTDQHAAI